MNPDDTLIEQCAVLLLAAERGRQEVHKITDDHPQLDVDDAYRIQARIAALKQAEGIRIVGRKMGLTSRAKMQQMGVETAIHGFLGSDNAVDDGGLVDTAALIHPKVEAEIAFVMRDSLQGPGCSVEQVLAATDYVVPAIELIDSRYENFRFDLPSVIADNTSASRFVLGSRPTDPATLDLPTLGVVMEKNGVVVEVGAGAAVLGHPAEAVAMLVDLLATQGETLPAGSVVLSGAITAAVAVQAGDNVLVRGDGIGTVSMRLG